MREYVALTGGRYTYADDILNLQDLAISMTTIFDGCSDFIVSGCDIDGTTISSGHVWLGGKVRYFEGANGVTFPHYIYEVKATESVVYANEANKVGRHNFACSSGSSVPEGIDPLTGNVSAFIEIREEYAPRFIDKFFGKYALLLDSPFSRQTVKKDLAIVGKLSSEKDIESKTAVSVANPKNGYLLKSIVKTTGDGGVGLYLNGLLVNEVVINTDGSFSFFKQNIELARIDENGLFTATARHTTAFVGSLSIYGSNIINADSNRDDGAVEVNVVGYNNSTSRFRNFIVYDGKEQQILRVEGKSALVGVYGTLTVNGSDAVAILKNSSFAKTDTKLKCSVQWQDMANTNIADIGYIDDSTFDMTIKNHIGNVVIASIGFVDIQADLKINGVYISTTYVNVTYFRDELAKKVNIVEGKALSDENFTTALKSKLEAIKSGSIEHNTQGYISSDDAIKALGLKLTSASNLEDVSDTGIARDNLDLYSRVESDERYLRISHKLSELVALSSDEINGLTPEEALELKAERQAAVRLNIDAERAGLADMKLAKLSNLADLPDKPQARKNISVYSVSEIDELLKGKLGTDSAYKGVVFTEDHRTKLDDIKDGSFAYTDNYGVSHAEVEGYVATAKIVRELDKKANRMMDGYNSDEIETISERLGFYTRTVSDSRFARMDSLFQDYITHWVNKGKSTAEAQQMMREKFSVSSTMENTNTYVRKDGKLGDLSLPNAEAKKLACRNLGAAYAEEYQTKLTDTGWRQMSNSGNSTDTGRLFIRQIGNVVSIQGSINTSKKDGSHWGGTIAIIPNSIQPPAHGLRTSFADYNDDHNRNRGASFMIDGGSRKLIMFESGMGGNQTNIHFTYMV